MYKFIEENFHAVKRDFQLMDSKVLEPGRIIVLIQPVFLNVHASELGGWLKADLLEDI